MAENVMNAWTKTIHCPAESSAAMKKKSDQKSNTATPGKIKGQRTSTTFYNGFEVTFAVVTHLVWFDSGLVDEKQQLLVMMLNHCH